MKKSFVVVFGFYLTTSAISFAQSKSVPEAIIAFLKPIMTMLLKPAGILYTTP